MTEPDFSARRPFSQTGPAFLCICLIFSLLAWFGRANAPFYGPAGTLSIGLAGLLLALCWIDLDRFVLPNFITYPLTMAGVLYSAVLGQGLLLSALGGLVGYSLIAGLAFYWRNRFGREGIGLGDAKLLAAGGTWIGLFGLPFILLIASGGVLAIIAILAVFKKPIGPQSHIPFGPALSIAIWAVWCLPQVLPNA